jgi:hypothetical protein
MLSKSKTLKLARRRLRLRRKEHAIYLACDWKPSSDDEFVLRGILDEIDRINYKLAS